MLQTANFEETQEAFDFMTKDELEDKYLSLLKHAYSLEERLRSAKAVLSGLN